MTTKKLVNFIGTLFIMQFFIGFAGIVTTDVWDIAIGFALIIAVIWAMVKVNKE